MTYTAEQLRDMVSLIEEQEVPADGQRIKMLRAFADALEENVRLKEQMSDLHTGYTTTLKELTADRDSWRGQADMHSETAHKQMQRADGLQAKLAKLRQHAEAMADEAKELDYKLMRTKELKIERATVRAYEWERFWVAVNAYRADFPEDQTLHPEAQSREQLTEHLEVSLQNDALIKNGLLKRAERAEAQLAEQKTMLREAFGPELCSLGHPAYVITHLREERSKVERLWKEATMQLAACRAECGRLRGTLELIAAPKRSDGTWNRDREACRALAQTELDTKEAER